MTDELVKESEINMEMEIPVIDRRYPIGTFHYQQPESNEEIAAMIDIIEEFPVKLKKTLAQYSEHEWDIPYREQGWTIRQVVHHVADSHMNAYVRFKLALTETEPTIKPYDQTLWAEMIDSKSLPLEVSLSLITALHQRWSTILRAMNVQDFSRMFFHPEDGRLHTLLEILALYAWHSNHHLAHIELVKPEKKAKTVKKPSVKKETAKKSTSAKAPAKKPSKKKS